MGYFLFVDESGQDRRASPYEVLAGLAIEDKEIWNFIQQIQLLEIKNFGIRISTGSLELKGKKLLKKKVFKHANQYIFEDQNIISSLAKEALNKQKGCTITKKELTALAQAKINFVQDILFLCSQLRLKIFASIINKNSPRPNDNNILRKDYSYLFERFYYYLEDMRNSSIGCVIFDELEKSKSHILVNQMEKYFQNTNVGKQRSSLIIPEPFFVHSDLTTLIQVTDIIAYIISWGIKIGPMPNPEREELADMAKSVCALRYKTTRVVNDNDNFVIWSFSLIDDLRPANEQIPLGFSLS